MAQIDADLATDYADRSLFIVGNDKASFALTAMTALGSTSGTPQKLYLVDLGVAGAGVTYVMRGYDGTLTSLVYWESSSVDSGGADYAGPGPLSDVVVQSVKGA